VGTAFTYQGRLNDGGIPASSDYDFQFALYDDLAGGNQLGNTIDQTITVDDGYFTTLLDFGQTFQGEARYLEVRVRTAGTGDPFTTLTPRQALTPVPYSLALPGLWTEQNATSPNLIGGYKGNSVVAGVVGATIAGGGASGEPNIVASNYSTVSGGWRNQAVTGTHATVGGGGINEASGSAATVSGGWGGAAAGEYSAVGGGYSNLAAGNWSAVGGGRENQVQSEGATVGGGYANLVSDWYATIGGGRENQATREAASIGGGWANHVFGRYGTVGGGLLNSATGDFATISGGESIQSPGSWASIGGGQNNTANGEYSTVGGGTNNLVEARFSTIPGGSAARTVDYGQMAYASGSFDASGDAQTSIYVLRRITTDATPTSLLLDGSSQHLAIPVSRTMTFEILIVARTVTGQSAGYRAQGVIENQAGTTGFVGTPTVTMLGEDVAAWNVTVLADDTNDALAIQVIGAAGSTIRWVATVRTAEVAW
jgi:hypothetical protein